MDKPDGKLALLHENGDLVEKPDRRLTLVHKNGDLVEKPDRRLALVHKNGDSVENIPKARILQMSEGLLTLYLHEKTSSIYTLGISLRLL